MTPATPSDTTAFINDPALERELAVLDLPREQIARLFALRHWILTTARTVSDTHVIVEGVGTGLAGVGLPLDRMNTAVEVRHSERSGVGRVWEPGKPPREMFFAHGPTGEEAFHGSPFGTACATGKSVRFDPRHMDDTAYGVVTELRAGGFTDYLCVPVNGFSGMRNGFSFATRAPGGFSPADISILDFTLPALAGLMELLVTRRILNEVARIYLGAEPAKRVLSGDVRRGEVMAMRAVILFADMRRFTDTSMGLTAQQTVDLLNHYYDCVVGPVESHGGEVLKFIADGVLAIFHAPHGAESETVPKAVSASLAALQSVEDLNETGTAPARFQIGIGLHLGEAAYGNVGSGERQDYTVIGRDVNIASRIAGLCSVIGEPLILSGQCAAHLKAGRVVDAGAHPLKGVPGLTATFVPKSGSRG